MRNLVRSSMRPNAIRLRGCGNDTDPGNALVVEQSGWPLSSNGDCVRVQNRETE
jgi:hypothetical protein